MQRVMDEEKINRLIDALLVMQEQEDTTTPALRSQLAETESAISNLLKAIEQGVFTPSTKQRLEELEAQKEEILVNIQTAELQKPKLTRALEEAEAAELVDSTEAVTETPPNDGEESALHDEPDEAPEADET